jgi:hypothetical protein
MFVWGLTLMAVGGLSFVLPMFGRQFILVSALGLTGAGSAAIGVVLFIVGFFLFFCAKGPSSRSTNSPADALAHSATHRAPSLESSVEEKSKIADSDAAATTEGRFALNGGEYGDPYEFGLGVVSGSLDTSRNIVNSLVGSEKMASQRAIKAQEGQVQLHALALVSAIYYVCANIASSADKHALTRLAEGMVDGFASIFAPAASGESARNNALSIYSLVQDYAQSLAKEMSLGGEDADREDPFDMGPTARLFVHNIAGQCGIQADLAASQGERMMLESIARNCGIFMLLTLLTRNSLTYAR